MNITKAVFRKLIGLRNLYLKLSRVKKLIIIAIVIGIGWFSITHIPSKQTQSLEFKAERGSIISTVSAGGNVSASSQTDVTTPATGIIEAVYVKNGDTVKAGQNLFKVKSTATPAQKASAYASDQNALSTLTSAKQSKTSLDAAMWAKQQAHLLAQNDVNYKNDNTTNPTTKKDYTDLEKQSIDASQIQAQKDFAAAEQKYKEADVTIAAAQATSNSSWINYQATQDSIVTAPVAGTVANLSISLGNTVTASNTSSNSDTSSSETEASVNSSSGSSTTVGSTVLVLGNFSQLSVIAQINEADISKIEVDQNATVTLDALPNQTFAGQIVSVDSVGTASDGVVTFNAYINLIVPPSEVKAGMTASIAIQTARADNVITVPTAAIQTLGRSSIVLVLKNGKPSPVPVTTGLSDGINTEIMTGINEGDVLTIGASGANGTTDPFKNGIIINGPPPEGPVPPKGMPGHGG